MLNLKYLYEKTRLKIFKRYTKFKTSLLGFPILVTDKSSYLYMYDEIFNKEIYCFNSNKSSPFILDCGANIGISIFYFKKKYPDSKIIAFEPNPRIFSILEENVRSSGYKNVTLINEAINDNESSMDFIIDDADAGRLVFDKKERSEKQIVKVKTTRLSSYLNCDIDFLKIDIEGSEDNVINECKNSLGNVRNIFIEYHSEIGNKQNLDKILSILTEAGFRYYIDRVGVYSPHPFLKFIQYGNFDLQLNISATKI